MVASNLPRSYPAIPLDCLRLQNDFYIFSLGSWKYSSSFEFGTGYPQWLFPPSSGSCCSQHGFRTSLTQGILCITRVIYRFIGGYATHTLVSQSGKCQKKTLRQFTQSWSLQGLSFLVALNSKLTVLSDKCWRSLHKTRSKSHWPWPQ